MKSPENIALHIVAVKEKYSDPLQYTDEEKQEAREAIAAAIRTRNTDFLDTIKENLFIDLEESEDIEQVQDLKRIIEKLENIKK